MNPVTFPGLSESVRAKVVRANMLNNGITVETILKITAEITEVKENEILSRDRRHKCSRARVVFQATCQNLLGMGPREIGRICGRSHSTVCASLNNHTFWMQNYPEYATLFRQVFIQSSNYLIPDL